MWAHEISRQGPRRVGVVGMTRSPAIGLHGAWSIRFSRDGDQVCRRVNGEGWLYAVAPRAVGQRHRSHAHT